MLTLTLSGSGMSGKSGALVLLLDGRAHGPHNHRNPILIKAILAFLPRSFGWR